MNIKHNLCIDSNTTKSHQTMYRAAMVDVWQTRPTQRLPHCRHDVAVAPAFYSSKSRQDLGLGGLASRGGPDVD